MGGSKGGYVTGPLQTIAGAGLTYMGMPELGVPLITAGVGQTAGTAAGHPGMGELAGAAAGGGIDAAGSAGLTGPFSQQMNLGQVGKDLGGAVNTPVGAQVTGKAINSVGGPNQPPPQQPAPQLPKPPSPAPVAQQAPTVTKAAGPGTSANNNQLTPQQLAMLKQMGGNTNPWAVS